MKVFIKHIIRNIKDNKKRSFLMLLSLFLTGLFASIVFTGYIFIDRFLVDMSKSMDSNYDFIVSSKNNESSITNEQLNDLFNTNAKYYFEVNEHGTINDKEIALTGIDLKQTQNFGYLVSKKKDKEYVLDKNEVIIQQKTAKKLNLKEGDKLIFTNSEGFDFELKVKYIINGDKIFSLGDAIIISIEDFKSLMGIENLKIYRYQVKLNTKITNEEYQKIKEEANVINLSVYNASEMAADVSLLDSLGDSTNEMILLFSLLSLILIVIVYFVNNSLVKIILNERIPITGTFRSVGASKSKMNFILMLEMMLYGFIAGLPSSFIGFFLVKTGITTLMNTGEEDELFSTMMLNAFNNNAVLIICASTIAIILIQLLLSIKEIIKCNRISVKDSIFSKYDNIYVYKDKDFIVGITTLIMALITIVFHNSITEVFGFMGVLCLIISFSKLLPFITKFVLERIEIKRIKLFKLAKENTLYGKLQMTNNVILGILIIIVMLLIFNANSSIKNYYATKDNYSFDIIINETSSSKLKEDMIKGLDGVSHYYKISIASTDLVDMISKSQYYLANIKFKTIEFWNSKDFSQIVNLDKNFLKLLNNPSQAETLKGNEIILDSTFMKKNDLNIGDYINFTIKKAENGLEDEAPIYLKIVGTHDFGKKVLLISDEFKKELSNLYYFRDIAYIVNNTNIDNSTVNSKITSILLTEDEIKELEENTYLEDIDDFTKPETIDEYLDSELASAKKELRISIIICIGIAVLITICLINNQRVSFIQRKKEFATLYSLCMSKMQLKSLIRTEFLISYFITAIISIVYMFLLKYLIVFTIENGGSTIEFSVSIVYMIGILLAILLIVLLISRKIVKEIDKLNIVEEIKYE